MFSSCFSCFREKKREFVSGEEKLDAHSAWFCRDRGTGI